MKKILAVFLALALVSVQIPAPAAALGTSASSAILMEQESGRVLYEHNADQPRLIASITKLMTALVALESGHDLAESVTIREEDTRTEGSSLYLRAGEQVRLETLLYGLLLQSGNDAALAVARHCGGSVEAFVAAMNEKAGELGMTHSAFANPSGLNADGHYASARDMALLARACLNQDQLARMAATRSITLEGRRFVNHNKLLWRYPGCVGLKTGYTEKAGRTLVSAAEREGMTLIVVTLNDPDDWADHAALFDYGFQGYQMQTLVRAGERLRTMPVSHSLVPFVALAAGEDLRWPVAQGEEITLRTNLLLERLPAPVQKNIRLGMVSCLVDGAEIGTVPLVTASEIHRDAADRRNLFQKILGGFF